MAANRQASGGTTISAAGAALTTGLGCLSGGSLGPEQGSSSSQAWQEWSNSKVLGQECSIAKKLCGTAN